MSYAKLKPVYQKNVKTNHCSISFCKHNTTNFKLHFSCADKLKKTSTPYT